MMCVHVHVHLQGPAAKGATCPRQRASPRHVMNTPGGSHEPHPDPIPSPPPRWKEGVFSQYSVIPYPEQLVSYIKHEFARMKVKQAELLGFTAAGGPRAKL
jgi:hypothetical protein